MREWGARVLFVVIGVAMLPGVAGAQFRDESRIRKSTRSILESSEFRHLRGRLQEVEVPRDAGDRGDGEGGGGGGGNGNGGRGGGANDGGEGGDGRAARGPDRDQGGAGRPDRRITRTRTREVDRSSSSWSNSGSEASGAGAGLGSFLHMLAWVLVAGVCGLILYYILRAMVDANRNREQPLSGDDAGETTEDPSEIVSAPGDLAADVYVTRARQLAAAGRLKEAVAHLLLGAMSFVETQGLIRFRRGLTFRSYVTALSGSKAAQQAFRALLRMYEPIEYGRREATRAHFEAALASYEEGFGSSPAGAVS